MEEIPTVVVDALDNDHGFVVLSRPYAFVQWAQKFINTIPENYGGGRPQPSTLQETLNPSLAMNQARAEHPDERPPAQPR